MKIKIEIENVDSSHNLDFIRGLKFRDLKLGDVVYDFSGNMFVLTKLGESKQ